jgi:hypothetical protein
MHLLASKPVERRLAGVRPAVCLAYAVVAGSMSTLGKSTVVCATMLM